MQTTDDMVGQTVECPTCRKQIVVPPPPPPEMPCAFCKALIPRDSVFCDVCGRRQPPDAAAPPPAAFNAKIRSRLMLLALPAAIALLIAVTAMAWMFLARPGGRDPDAVAETAGAAAADAPPDAAVSVTDMDDAAQTPADDYPVTVVAAPPVEPPPPPPPEPAAAPPVEPPPPPPPAAPAPESPPAETNAAPENESGAADEVVALFERTCAKYKEVLEEIERNYRGRVVQVQTNFLGSLEKMENTMQEKGDLMGVLAVRKEQESFQGISEFPPKIRSAGSTYAEVADLKKKYNQQLDALQQDRDQEIALRTRQYDNRLAEFERRLTQAGKIDDALRVHAERERVRSQSGN